jgi:CRISPR-associated exonuclease Cas4
LIPPDESVPISALQHWLFCPRQCALIHVERLWAENRLTAEGRILHTRADSGKAGRRGGVKSLRDVAIGSTRYGLHGVADVVELHGALIRPYPVEYKRGRPKAHRADEVQLCAQALCLEEMFDCPIAEGALYYGANRRRKVIALDADLRALTLETAAAVGAMMCAGILPPPRYEPRRCNACSLLSLCRPKARRSAARWLADAIAADVVPE